MIARARPAVAAPAPPAPGLEWCGYVFTKQGEEIEVCGLDLLETRPAAIAEAMRRLYDNGPVAFLVGRLWKKVLRLPSGTVHFLYVLDEVELHALEAVAP